MDGLVTIFKWLDPSRQPSREIEESMYKEKFLGSAASTKKQSGVHPS
jgi:hypothetical protein